MTQHNPPSQPGYPGNQTPPPAPGYGAAPGQGGAPGYGAVPPQGGAPDYGAAPPQGGAPAYGAPPAYGTPPAGEQPKSGGIPPIVKRIGFALIGIAVILGIRFGIGFFTGPGTPEVGDCINGSSISTELAVVECDSADAAWTVIGTGPDLNVADFDATPIEEMCAAHPTSQNAILWGYEGDSTGDVFCVTAVG